MNEKTRALMDALMDTFTEKSTQLDCNNEECIVAAEYLRSMVMSTICYHTTKGLYENAE